jgi:hypothetical protein
MEDQDCPPVTILACAIKVMAQFKGQREDETFVAILEADRPRRSGK